MNQFFYSNSEFMKRIFGTLLLLLLKHSKRLLSKLDALNGCSGFFVVVILHICVHFSLSLACNEYFLKWVLIWREVVDLVETGGGG